MVVGVCVLSLSLSLSLFQVRRAFIDLQGDPVVITDTT